MDKRLAIALVLGIGEIVACGNQPGKNSAEEGQKPLSDPTEFIAATTVHTINVTVNTTPGTPTDPSIVTLVSRGGADTIAWVSQTNGNNLTITGLNSAPSPYPGAGACAGTTQQCTSGNISAAYTQFAKDYTIQVGAGPIIYGRIIINK